MECQGDPARGSGGLALNHCFHENQIDQLRELLDWGERSLPGTAVCEGYARLTFGPRLDRHFMRFAAQFGAISLLLAVWGPAAFADVIILNFEEPRFATGHGRSGPGNLRPDAVSRAGDRRHVTTTAGFSQGVNMPGTLDLFVTITHSGVIRSVLLGGGSLGGDVEKPAEAAAAKGSSGLTAVSTGSLSPSESPDPVANPSARSDCRNGICRDPLDDNSGVVFSFDFSNFVGGVSLQRIDILDFEDESTGETLTIGLFEEIKSRIADTDRDDGASPITGGTLNDNAASRLDLQNFCSGNIGVNRYQIELDDPGA